MSMSNGKGFENEHSDNKMENKEFSSAFKGNNNKSSAKNDKINNTYDILNVNSNFDKNKHRIWELDFFRGIALLLMIYFHVIFDLSDIFGYNVDYTVGLNKLAGRMAGILFILISGISCSLSRNNFKRALKILAVAIGISIITHVFDPNMGIKFGILHFLGLSILLYPLLRKLNGYLLAIIGTMILIAGNLITKINVTYDYLFILGITSNRFISADYYPLIPWLGIFIYGIILGEILYNEKKSIFRFQMKDNIIMWLGRNTLLIYIIHQPIIIFIIAAIKKLLYSI